MKILIINNSSKLSGAEISLLHLADSLSRRHELTFVIPEKGPLYYKLIDKYEVKIYKLKRHKKVIKISEVFNILSVCLMLSTLVTSKRFDLVYANNNQAQLYCILIRVFTLKRIVWHVRDNLNNKLMAWLFAFFSYRIIAVSVFISDKIPCSPNKKKVIYNGIDINKWKSSDAIVYAGLRKQLKLNLQSPLIGQIGQLVPWKGHMDFITVAEIVLKTYKDAHFVIIGDDLFNENPDYVNLLKETVVKRKMESNITLLSYREEIQSYISELDLIIHCAKDEPFGRVIIESLHMQKPVVAYSSGGVKEIIVNGENGFLVDPLNVNEFSKRLIFLLKEKRIGAEFGNSGKVLVSKKFNVDKLNLELESFITGLC